MASGYIKLFRQIAEHPLWTEDKFSRAQAWIDLIILANWRDGAVRTRGIRVDLKRGQLLGAERYLSRRWEWSTGKVRRFLKELKNDARIDAQKNNVGTVITILNYDAYQSDEAQTDAQTDAQTKRRRSETKKNKESKEGKEQTREGFPESLNVPGFAEAWSEWEQHRKEKNKKLTPTSVRLQLKELEAMGPTRSIAAIRHSIAKGWTGIFEPSAGKAKRNAHSGINDWLSDDQD